MEDLEPGRWKVEGESRRTTLGEHGPQRVIGSDGAGLRFQSPDVELRAAIGRHVNDNPYLKKKPGLAMLYRVGLYVRKMGDASLDDMEPDERAVAVGGLRLPDLAYLSFCARAEEDGGEIDHAGGWECPKCGAEIRNTALDITTLGVTVFDAVPSIHFRPKSEWRLRGKPVESATMQFPTLAQAIEPMRPEEFASEDLWRIRVLSAAITAVNGKPRSVTPEEFRARDEDLGRGMTSKDLDRAWLALHNGGEGGGVGPDSFVKWRHGGADEGGCDGTVNVPLDWATAFFSPSAG